MAYVIDIIIFKIFTKDYGYLIVYIYTHSVISHNLKNLIYQCFCVYIISNVHISVVSVCVLHKLLQAIYYYELFWK